MTQRYLALISRRHGICDEAAERFRASCKAATLEILPASSATMVAASAATPRIVPPDGGPIVLGYLHQLGRQRSVTNLSAHDVAEIGSTTGRRLTSGFWGSYVALHNREGDSCAWVIRAPLGDLPCFVVEQPEIVFLSSDAALLLYTAGLRPAVDIAALARFLLADDVRNAETCLAGVRELPGGWRLEISGGCVEWQEIWSPWEGLGRSPLDDRHDAIAHVRDTVQHAVGAVVSRHERPLLRLSGGIDSSVVAAAWPSLDRPVDAVTFVTDDASGDERSYASAVAAHLGMTLHERQRQVADIDPTRSDAVGLPRPSARLFAQASDAMTRNVGQILGCDAAIDGGGGDSVFCYAINPRLAADCLLEPKGREHFWPTVHAIAGLAAASPFTVARKAWGWTWRRRSYRHACDERFLTPSAIAAAAGIIRRWPAPPSALPGKIAHVAGIALIAGAQEDAEGPSSLIRCSPLLTQPVVETCLRVPSWWWVEGGFNRAVVRHAFAERLPDSVRWRRTKGTPDSFLIQILEAHRELLRSMLMDGELARAGLIDREAVAAAFRPAALALGADFYRLLRLVDAEAWLRSWQRASG